MIAATAFWFSFLSVVYAYAFYPLVLVVMSRWPVNTRKAASAYSLPRVSIVIPAHNEAMVLRQKIENTLSLEYPAGLRQIIVVSDGSQDATNDIVREYEDGDRFKFVALQERGGKAKALNAGVKVADGNVIVFSDASIMLEKGALRAIVAPFADEKIGCVSGEDHILGSSGEGMYGRYELWLRNLESKVDSIVGASGCFYAQRVETTKAFPEGVAPDFFSVLETVKSGYRAVTCPEARGRMIATVSTDKEFERKVRTVVRGMAMLWDFRTALFLPGRLRFSISLLSHKLIRWLVPIFMIVAFVSSMILAMEGGLFWVACFLTQVFAYGIAFTAWVGVIDVERYHPVRILTFFISSNVAILQAWLMFLSGQRIEIWQPTNRR
ncbi:MAG: glycosyltransferase family 2 protein [Pseudomonadales bacterium]